MTVKGVESRLEKGLLLFLKENDYLKVSEQSFEKKIDTKTTFHISFNVKGFPPDDFSIQTIFSIQIREIDKYWIKYRTMISDDRNPHPSFISFLISDFHPELAKKYHMNFDGTPRKSFGEGRELIKTEDDIFNYLIKFKGEYQKLVVPFFNKAIQTEWIDKELNSDYLNFNLNFFNSKGLVYRKLIVAKLVNNPDYEKMYIAFRERWTGWFDKYNGKDLERLKKHIEVLDKVYIDLK